MQFGLLFLCSPIIFHICLFFTIRQSVFRVQYEKKESLEKKSPASRNENVLPTHGKLRDLLNRYPAGTSWQPHLLQNPILKPNAIFPVLKNIAKFH